MAAKRKTTAKKTGAKKTTRTSSGRPKVPRDAVYGENEKSRWATSYGKTKTVFVHAHYRSR